MKNIVLKWSIIALAFLILFMPNAIRYITILYSVDAEQYVVENLWVNQHPWLHYYFSYIELFSVIAALIIHKEYRQINIIPVVGLIVTINIARYLIGSTSIFQFNDYSLILSLLSGYGCYLLLTSSRICNLDVEDLLDAIIILNTITQILFVLTGRQMEYGGRYGALGSDVGTVGAMCSQYLVYFIFCRNSTRQSLPVLACCMISLILSGSRTNLLFAIAFTGIFAFRIPSSLRENGQTAKSITYVVLAAIIIIPVVASLFSNSVLSTVIDRMVGIVTAATSENKEYFDNDGSMVGRLLSFKAGLSTLVDYPLGLSASTIDLQMETINHGYVSFPHSTMLSYYLLWSFGAVVIYYYIFKWMIMAMKTDSRVWLFLMFFIVTSIIYGAPMINAKNYFWYLLLFTYCRNDVFRLESN